MKLTIELDTGAELSGLDKAILTAIMDTEEIPDVIGIVKQIKPAGEHLDLKEGIVAGGGGGGGDTTVINQDLSLVVQPTLNGDPPLDTNCFTGDQPEDIDAAGMPWDARINPKSRGKIKTGKRQGMWKYIKQLEDKQPGLIAKVEAENKARLIKQVHAPETEPTEFEMGDNGQAIAAKVFAAPNTEPDPAVETTADPDAFGKMLSKLTPRMIEKPEFAEKINAALAAHGVKGLPDLLAKHPELIPQIDQELDALWATV